LNPVIDVPQAAGRATRLTALGRQLAADGYTPAGLRKALGSAGPLVEGATAGDRRRRARSAGRTGALARLFLLQDAIDAGELERILGEVLTELDELGLVREEGGLVQGTVQLVPHDDLLMASDRYGAGAAGDQVPGVQGPSFLLGALAIRRPVARALDLGTGCGIQSLLISPFAERVVATDVNERALAFAELNLALNGIENVELRHGSLYEPVEGEQFGLVLANPPYVISPDRSFLFRDSPLGGEGISEAVVRGLGDALEPGGHASVLVSWDATGANDRPVTWLAGSGCSGLVLVTSKVNAEANAEKWHVGADRDEGVERWIAYFAASGIEEIAYGAVVVRKQPGGLRVMAVPDEMAGIASEQLQRLLDAPDGVTAGDRVEIVPGVALEERRRFAAGGWLREVTDIVQTSGFPFRAGLDESAVAITEQLDGRHTLGELGLDRAGMGLVGELVQYGFARVVSRARASA
jgi:methylase of polypeptide subunit release factors